MAILIIGVTGGLGTGKSTVAAMFKRLGAIVIDADQLAHEVMKPKRLAWRRITETFGPAVLNPDHTIHHQKLAALVFHDAEARRRLEAIVHPHVFRLISERLKRLKRNRRIHVVVLDVPLLIETRGQDLVDKLVVVTAPDAVARDRLIKRGLTVEDIAARNAAQAELSAKAALADVVIDNGRGVEHTRTQVMQAWAQLAPRRRRRA